MKWLFAFDIFTYRYRDATKRPGSGFYFRRMTTGRRWL
ncbi:hypothetical protein GDI1326 [Gluconacetobacter diazotrophicus PA1 5]|uniref:Uncharacterized protein n=1 Tax=Gluconacetobacter diazotrophicus (strain ATCC 49037 / DSM 5601 / CCUG 37298 / CIP 103539 / LMG 7603 / PAl5) TaxID=272568 RepID=A9HER5_GLUDA|nr:hypothetical protein GDI1326 [Gluconacetobacter diazotrophicus PA1 5]